MNEQLDEINSALSELGYKAPNDGNPDVQNLSKMKSEILSMNSQFAELKKSTKRGQVFKMMP